MTDDEIRKLVEDRVAALIPEIVEGIALGHKIHDARPLIERQGLEIQYGTIVGVSATEVQVTLDADLNTPVAMFTMVNVAPGERVATVLVPPSSGLVLGVLGGIANTVLVQTTAGQVALPLEITDPNGVDLITITPSGALDLTEQVTPAAPAALTARIFAVDDGTGKVSLRALFPTGSAQTLATEP